MSNRRIGFALCGSFCTFETAIKALRGLKQTYPDVTPVMSESAFSTDTRFGAAADFVREIEDICKKPVLHTIRDVEPFGPAAQLDLLIIAPATGNTISKLAAGITDTSVTMAAKAHLRNSRPVLIALSTNDALSGSAPSLGTLLYRRNIYFVPFYQDDPHGKPASLVADFGLLTEAAEAALRGVQLQPLLAANVRSA